MLTRGCCKCVEFEKDPKGGEGAQKAKPKWRTRAVDEGVDTWGAWMAMEEKEREKQNDHQARQSTAGNVYNVEYRNSGVAKGRKRRLMGRGKE